jgi:tripartite ATP-independent transporter DctP family solute receptor
VTRAPFGRRRVLQLLAGSVAAAVAPTVLAAEPRDRWVLRAADIQPADYPTSRALQFLGERLEQLSGGRLGLKLFSGGRLGDESDTLEITIFGGIDINRVNLAPLTSIERLTEVLALPFLFRSTAHMRAVVDGDVGRAILDALEPHGLVGLAFYDSGARSFYNARRPIRTVADMRGLKIRVQNSELAIAMVRALGANATPMGFGQVFESLVLGTVDGSENNSPSYVTARHFEPAPHYTLTRHTMAPEVVVMSRHRWRRLAAADRELVRQAALDSVSVMRSLWDVREADAFNALRRSNVTIVEDFDRAGFERAVQPLYAKWLREPRMRALVEQIRASAA